LTVQFCFSHSNLIENPVRISKNPSSISGTREGRNVEVLRAGKAKNVWKKKKQSSFSHGISFLRELPNVSTPNLIKVAPHSHYSSDLASTKLSPKTTFDPSSRLQLPDEVVCPFGTNVPLNTGKGFVGETAGIGGRRSWWVMDFF